MYQIKIILNSNTTQTDLESVKNFLEKLGYQAKIQQNTVTITVQEFDYYIQHELYSLLKHSFGKQIWAIETTRKSPKEEPIKTL